MLNIQLVSLEKRLRNARKNDDMLICDGMMAKYPIKCYLNDVTSCLRGYFPLEKRKENIHRIA